MPKLMPAKLRRAEYLVVMSVVFFIVMAVIASVYGGSEDIISHLRRLTAPVTVGLLFLSLVNYFARFCRWHLLSRQLRITIPLRRNAIFYVAGFSMTTTPGKMGEALRLWLMERCHSYGYERLAPLFVADRLSDVSAMLVLCILGVAGVSGYEWTIVLLSAVFLIVALPFFYPRPLIAFISSVHMLFGRRWSHLFASIRRSVRLTAGLFTWKLFSGNLLLSTAGWLAECIAFYWLLVYFGAPISLQQATFIFAFSMLAGAVTMLPGGLGGVEAAMLGLLVALGTEFDVAVASTVLIRATTLWFSVVLGFLVLPVALRIVRQSTIVTTPSKA